MTAVIIILLTFIAIIVAITGTYFIINALKRVAGLGVSFDATRQFRK